MTGKYSYRIFMALAVPIVFVIALSSACVLKLSARDHPSFATTDTIKDLVTIQPPVSSEGELPDLIWGYPAYGTRLAKLTDPLLVVRGDRVAFETKPVPFSGFWDYSPLTGKMAYTEFQRESGLWVYDFIKRKTQPWSYGVVVRALFSPIIDPRTNLQSLAVAVQTSDKGRWKLRLYSGAENYLEIADHVNVPLSWSPDGRWLLYGKSTTGGTQLFLFDSSTMENKQITTEESETCTYYSEVPAWSLDNTAVILACGSYIHIVFLDKQGTVHLNVSEIGYIQPSYSPTLLWDEETSILVADTIDARFEWMIFEYKLSDDLRSLVDVSPVTGAANLVSWWNPGNSILLANGDCRDLKGRLIKTPNTTPNSVPVKYSSLPDEIEY